jgi:NRPS condensation-like uncharacterized protein
MKKKYTPKRGTGNTRISISMPVEMREAIESAALRDKRTISNYLVTRFEAFLKEEARKEANSPK